MMLQLDFNAIAAAVGGIGILILILVIAVLIHLFSLKIGINAVKGKKTKLSEVFITALINWIITIIGWFIPFNFIAVFLITLIVQMLVIKGRHDTTFFGALGALIIAWIMVLIIIVVLGFVFGFSLAIFF